ncbi:tetratricopeptide repeat protein [Streptomyces sp. NPDC047315]|uniref:tetratricopeptide repeat protein n=1 Tax=Streptomyces sp. NPDC047315 TaxID=3155142 RepID=UPI00340D97F0
MKGEAAKNVAVGTLVVATLITGVVLAFPGTGRQGPPPLPGPLARAETAVLAGAPASVPELDALIADRRTWLKGHPKDEASWAALGSAYTERAVRAADWSAYGKAEQALKRSLAALPGERGNTDALLGLAVLAGARNDFVAAKEYATLARKQKPRRWTVHRALVDAYSGLGDHKAAEKSLESVQSLYDGAQARSLAARVYRDRGWREDAAASAYDAVGAARGATERAHALWRLGELSWERGEPEEAVGSYDAALRLAPDLHPALASRARALAAVGRTDEALRDYRAALTKAALPEYALEAGELAQSLDLDAEATAFYGQVRAAGERAAAQGVNVQLTLGRYEADHGDPAEAVRMLRAEWDRGRRSPETADALAWALHRAGRSKEGLPQLVKAMKDGPRSALFAYHRGEIERSLGMYGAARRHIGEALRTNPSFSPLLAPAARSALTALGEPPEGGPRKLTGREGQGGSGGTPAGQQRRTGTGQRVA